MIRAHHKFSAERAHGLEVEAARLVGEIVLPVGLATGECGEAQAVGTERVVVIERVTARAVAVELRARLAEAALRRALRDGVDGAGGDALPVEQRLRAAQHLEPLHVERVALGERDEAVAPPLLFAREAAQAELLRRLRATARAVERVGHVRRELHQVRDIGRADLIDECARVGIHRHRQRPDRAIGAGDAAGVERLVGILAFDGDHESLERHGLFLGRRRARSRGLGRHGRAAENDGQSGGGGANDER